LLPAQVVSVAGLWDFLRVYRSVYLESNDVQRKAISLAVSSFGYCLTSARRALQASGELKRGISGSPFLSEETERRTGDLDLSQMAPPTKDEFVALFHTPKDAMDQLLLLSCRSDPRVKARSRDLLSRYFGIDPSSIPCLPCE
jgi:hypothetical protein